MCVCVCVCERVNYNFPYTSICGLVHFRPIDLQIFLLAFLSMLFDGSGTIGHINQVDALLFLLECNLLCVRVSAKLM